MPSLETDVVMVVATAMMYIAGELAHKLPKLNNEAAARRASLSIISLLGLILRP